MIDWDNVGRMVWEQKVCEDYVHAATVAVQAGNDLVMTISRFFEGAQEAVQRGDLDESLIDDAVRRLLTLKLELGLLEDPRLPDVEQQAKVIGSPNTPPSTLTWHDDHSYCLPTTAHCRSMED